MRLSLGTLGALAVLIAAAFLEVGGDAFIRKGMRGGGFVSVGLGLLVLGSYGVLINVLDIDFSKLLGAYVGIFALVSVLVGRLAFSDQIPIATWVGLATILGGSLMVHFGRGR